MQYNKIRHNKISSFKKKELNYVLVVLCHDIYIYIYIYIA